MLTNEDLHAESKTAEAGKKQGATQKRQINFGLGGFNPKARSRARPHDAHADPTAGQSEMAGESGKVNKRVKKKSVLEEMIPVYMQEAFFGAQVLSTQASLKENEDFNLEEDEATLKVNSNNKDDLTHKISLDENMLKQAQQNKKAHLELGIEDFLDGDIVSYLFNENKNLMDINSYQGI